MTARRRASLWSLLVILPLWAAEPARAQDGVALAGRLRVRPGATCLRAESLGPLVSSWLLDAELPESTTIEVDGSEHDAHSARFRIVVSGLTVAHRAFEPGPPSCEQLRAALGLSIALSLKVSLLSDLGRALPDDPVARAQAWSVHASALGSYRVLPGLAAGFDLRVQRGLGPHWALRAGVLGLYAPGIDLARVPGGFDALLAAGRAEICVRGFFTPALSGRVCLGALAGALHASGRGGGARSATLAWLAVSNAAALELALPGSWSVELELGLFAPLRQLRMGVVDGRGRELESRVLASTGFSLAVGPGYRF